MNPEKETRVDDVEIAHQAAEIEKPLRDKARSQDKEEWYSRFAPPTKEELDENAEALSDSYLKAVEKVPQSESEKKELIKESLDKVSSLGFDILKRIEAEYPYLVKEYGFKPNESELLGDLTRSKPIYEWLYGMAASRNMPFDERERMNLMGYARQFDDCGTYFNNLQVGNLVLVDTDGGKFIPEILNKGVHRRSVD